MPKTTKKRVSAWQRWWVEILALTFLPVGLLLLVEDFSIRETIGGILNERLANLGQVTEDIRENLKLSNLLAGCLLLLILVVCIRRIKYQLAQVESLRGFRCPHCQGTVERSHRRWWEKPVSALFGIRPYRCAKRECNWRGWRYRG